MAGLLLLLPAAGEMKGRAWNLTYTGQQHTGSLLVGASQHCPLTRTGCSKRPFGAAEVNTKKAMTKGLTWLRDTPMERQDGWTAEFLQAKGHPQH